MTAVTASRASSTRSSRKAIQGTPATQEIWTIEVEDEYDGWLSYDAGLKAGPIFYVTADAAKEVARDILGEDKDRPVRVVRWFRLVTTERI
jgi:hypothetical protein